MIKLTRGEKPKILDAERTDLAYEKMEEFYNMSNRSQRRYDFPFNSKIDNELKPEMHEAFHGKCAYCETKISSPQKGTIDRYRPNNGVRDEKEYFADLYWWLNFDWDNLLYCCKTCNQYKANYFPIKGNRAKTNEDDLSDELRLLINPCIDDPDQHLHYDESGDIRSLTEIGHQTINLLRLDRVDLIEKRVKSRDSLIRIFDDLTNKRYENYDRDVKFLRDIYEGKPSIEFLAYKRYVLLTELDSSPVLAKILDIEEYQPREITYRPDDDPEEYDDIIRNDFFPIEYVEINQFKGISSLRINFKEDDFEKKSWLFLLGENGVGKSSILQAIAIGLKADKKLIDEKLVPELVMKGKQKATIKIKERHSNNIVETVLIRKDGRIEQNGSFNSFLIGYGSLRLSTDDIKAHTKKDTSSISYDNLYKPTLPLNDITKWLRKTYNTDRDLFNRVAYSIGSLLPEEFRDDEMTIEGNKVKFSKSGKSFSELSDGFQSTIILAVDIMMKLSSGQSDMDKMSGIVLIDELGNQLHPRWQMRIVSQLREVFRNLNFIVSTHHPLCMRGASKNEILLLKNINENIIATNKVPDPSSLRVDQILASEFFGLNSLVDPMIEAKFNQYYRLLGSENNLSSDDRAKLDNLKTELQDMKQMGSSLREEMMYSVIDELLAKKIVFTENPNSRAEIRTEILNRVEELWNEINQS